MKQKKTKAVVVILALLLSFFGFKTTLAYTELYSDDFDSYPSGACFTHGVSLGGWLTRENTNLVCMNQNEYKSYPNSLYCQDGQAYFFNNDFITTIEQGETIKRVFSIDVFFNFGNYNVFTTTITANKEDGGGNGLSFMFSAHRSNGDWDAVAYAVIAGRIGSSTSKYINVFTDWTNDDFENAFNGKWINVALELEYRRDYDGYYYNDHSAIVRGYVENECIIEIERDHDAEKYDSLKPFLETFLVYVDNFSISTGFKPSVVNGECGAYNGQKMTLQDFDASSNTGKCAKGSYTGFWNDGYFGYWFCKGSDDGSDDVCSVSWETQSGACGAYNGQKMTLQDFDASSNTGKCAVGEYKNFSSDLLNGYWTCGGVAMGDDVNCSVEWRDDDEVILPDLPDLEDCSSLSIPNKWFCEMRNFFLSAFFPSADKMNDLTKTIDRMKNKAPFNYLRLVKDKFDNLNENIQQVDQVEISLLGNTGTIDFDTIPLRKIIFNGFSIIVVIGFAFWALRYIKSIF